MGLYDTSSLVHKLVNRHCGMLHTAVLVEGGCGKKDFFGNDHNGGKDKKGHGRNVCVGPKSQ